MKNAPATSADLELALAAANLVAQFSSNNPMPPPAIAGMIKTVHETLVDLVDNGKRATFATEAAPAPAALPPGPQSHKPATYSGLQKAPTSQFNPGSVLGLDSPMKKPVGVRKEPINAFRAEFVIGEPSAEPFIPIDESVFTDRIICLECGNAFTNITRHIKAYHQLSDREYRMKYGLSAQYPFSCPDYVAQRVKLAKDNKDKFRPLNKQEHAERKLRLASEDGVNTPPADSSTSKTAS